MRVLITGGSGFIGRHVMMELIKRGVRPIVLTRNVSKIHSLNMPQQLYDCIEGDLNFEFRNGELEGIDRMIHLAWSGLPEYKKMFHIEENLMLQYFFIKKMIELGIKQVVVSGTCLEYGMVDGCLKSDMETKPHLPYALAKDSLRKFLMELQKQLEFKLRWVRLFYTYGNGQASTSILSQLAKAIEHGDSVFNMSVGDQQRDYLPVQEVAKQLVDACLLLNETGIYNCCSGEPISISNLVEQYIVKNGASIQLNKGYYSYPDYEPHAFWGYPDLKNFN